MKFPINRELRSSVKGELGRYVPDLEAQKEKLEKT